MLDTELPAADPTLDEAQALVGRLIENGLGDVLKDVDLQRRLAEGMCALGLPLPLPIVQNALKILAPAVCAVGGVAGSWLGAKVRARTLDFLLKLPLAGRILVWLDKRITGRNALSELINAASPDARNLPFSLPQDLRAHYAGLDQQLQIKEQLDKLDIWLRERLNPRLPIAQAAWDQNLANRFHYRSHFIPFKGREAEIAALGRFLGGEQTFCWALVQGQGGIGKSRLALEFCLRHAGAFESGFLAQDAAAVFDWEAWHPRLPTLIVIDYASGDPEGVRRILRTLQRRQEAFEMPVRVLLLNRTAADSWYERLLDGSSEGGNLGAVRFEDEVFALQPLADAWPIIAFFFERQNKPRPSKSETLTLLRSIDPGMRPLFAAFLGDALAEGRDARGWDRERLVGYVLRNERKWWPSDLRAEEEHLYVLATMTRGLNLEAALAEQSPILPDERTIDEERLCELVGRPIADALPPLEPDILGELLVLEHLRKKPLRLKPLRNLAWRLAPSSMELFLVLLMQDYGDDPLAQKLVEPPTDVEPGILHSWAKHIVSQLFFPYQKRHIKHYQDLRILSEENPNSAQMRECRAKALFNLIADLAPKNISTSTTYYEELRQLAFAHPDEPILRDEQGRAAVNLLNAFGVSASELLSEETYIDSLFKWYKELVELVNKHTDETILREHLAFAQVNLINDLCSIKNNKSFKIYYELRKLANDYPDEIFLCIQQGRGLVNLAFDIDAGNLNKIKTLLQNYKNSINNYPNVSVLFVQLAEITFNLFICFVEQDNIDQAQALYSDLRYLAKQHNLAEARIRQAKAVVNLIGRVKEDIAWKIYAEIQNLVLNYQDEVELCEAQSMAAVNLIIQLNTNDLKAVVLLFDDIENLSQLYPDKPTLAEQLAKGKWLLNQMNVKI